MSCSARPTQLRAIRLSAGSPKIRTSPSVMRMRLHTALISVVLPAPFGPSRPKNAPSGTVRSKSSSATVPSSHRLVRPVVSSAAGTPPRLAAPFPLSGFSLRFGDLLGVLPERPHRIAPRKVAIALISIAGLIHLVLAPAYLDEEAYIGVLFL